MMVGAVQPVRVMRIAAEARDDAHRHIPQRGIDKGSAIAGARVQRDQAAPGSHGQRLDLPSRVCAMPWRRKLDAPAACAPRRGAVDWAVSQSSCTAGQPAVLPGGQAAPHAGSTLSRQNASASSGLYGRTKLTLVPACTLACSSSASSGSRVSGFGGRERGHAQGGKMVGHVAPVDVVVQTMKSAGAAVRRRLEKAGSGQRW